MAEKKTDTVSNAVDEDRVTIMIPYVEGEDSEVTVGINGVFTKIQKGVQVKVTKDVADVLQRSYKQTMVAVERRRKLKNQVTDL